MDKWMDGKVDDCLSFGQTGLFGCHKNQNINH